MTINDICQQCKITKPTFYIKKAQEKGEIQNTNNPGSLYNALAHLFTGHELKWCISGGKSSDFDDFFMEINDILDVREDLRDIYKCYLEEITP